jgi:hypothetical protein
VDAKNARAALKCQHVGRDSCCNSLVGPLGAGQFAKETLAREAYYDGETERRNRAKVGEQIEVVVERLAEADPWVDGNALALDPGCER